MRLHSQLPFAARNGLYNSCRFVLERLKLVETGSESGHKLERRRRVGEKHAKIDETRMRTADIPNFENQLDRLGRRPTPRALEFQLPAADGVELVCTTRWTRDA